MQKPVIFLVCWAYTVLKTVGKGGRKFGGYEGLGNEGVERDEGEGEEVADFAECRHS